MNSRNIVRKVTLGEICFFLRGQTITSKNAVDGGIPVVAGGLQPSYYHNVSNRKANTIAVAGSGAYAGYVSFWDKPIYLSDAFSVETGNNVVKKYIYYFLKLNQEKIYSFQKGAGIPHVHGSDIKNLLINLPDVTTQEEIVKILDSFTNLIDALNEELSLRQKQFEYYREKLLTFDDKIEFDTLKLVHIDDICNVSRGASPRPIKNYLTQSEEGVPWIKIGDVNPFDKYINKTNERITKEGAKKSRFLHKGDLILSNSLSFGRPYILDIDGCIHDGWISLSGFENYVLIDFLYEVLNTKSVQNYWTMKANNGGAMSNLNSDIVKSTIIKIPSIKNQEEIVKILNSFTNLISSLKEEIALRQKQYEYYREKLLTFE